MITNTNINTGNRASWLRGPSARCDLIRKPGKSQWRFVLLGPPGIGKGTQAEYLSGALGACHLSTGDVFRHAFSSGETPSPAMARALDCMKRGELVSDDLVIDMVRERSRCLKCRFGFLLDGFPRTVPQAEALDDALDRLAAPLHGVIAYDLDPASVIGRLSGRRTCRSCKSTFHVEAKPPRIEGVCDHCGGDLFQRDDDKPETILVRLQAYRESTEPLEEYYRRDDRLVQIDADGNPDEVFAQTLDALKESLGVIPDSPSSRS